jgi:uncharacterized protein (TIGR02391 family)
MPVNIRLIAIEAGDVLKWISSVNEIERIGSAIFPFRRDTFPHDSITSSRAQLIYDWLMSLGRHPSTADERARLTEAFLLRLARDDSERNKLLSIMTDGGMAVAADQSAIRRFDERKFHAEINVHCRTLYGHGHFFHAVFEAAKTYNRFVQIKSGSSEDGQKLMMSVWGPDNGVLKVTACQTETDRNVQDGIKFLSAGLVQAIRNPTAHEPALHWPIAESDALDLLSFISFLLRQLDKAVKHP